MSGRGGGGVVDGERCGGLVWVYGRRKRNRVSDERERERGNEVELEIFILLKGIIVISHKRTAVKLYNTKNVERCFINNQKSSKHVLPYN